MGVEPGKIAEKPVTRLMADAVRRLADLPEDRQNEIARMLIDAADAELSGDLQLTEQQLAEVDRALAEDGPYVSREEMETFFARYQR
ncbi:ParB-like chromosome segregation protein Spo0J [Methylopila capsulata]|uniref:ParB-like chromosome segregation protein Spo0J n=1 Tax=Methylopila capsulata TaxID=61654 RepID=A0A9W6IYD2_9HYPH|nr:hypothetical protein [Methylopila capsulata]MBM7852975.1 ParB-like chromosome segregation protein Spo0J [Methylopila capsulata]GLK57814.1 hypothetical protein GCM10008170_38340 [Methylopila capsulata]